MPKTVLIIEDDEATARLLELISQRMGLEVIAVERNGKEGLHRALAKSPDLVLLDLLLPGMDGIKLAKEIRSEKLPSAIIVVTAVYKDPRIAKELADRCDAEVIYKPFRAGEIEAAISRKLGIPVPKTPVEDLVPPAPAVAPGAAPAGAMPRSGSLAEKPVASVIMEVVRARSSGVLELTRGTIKRRLYFDFGSLRHAQSNVKGENVGGMQLAERTLSEAAFAAAVTRARAEGIQLGEALAREGAMTVEQVAAATRRQNDAVVLAALPWRDGEYRFEPGEVSRVPDHRQDPLALLLSGYWAQVRPDLARQWLAPLAAAKPARTPELERSLYAIRATFSGEGLTPQVNGFATIEELLGHARPSEAPLLLALVELGLVRLPFVPAVTAKAAAPAAGQPKAATDPVTLRAREVITREWQRVANAGDLYAVLGVDRKASPEAVRAAYLPLAKRFHADAFSGLALGSAAEALNELFSRLTEAYSTLSDPKQRANYDIALERKQAGLPTEVGVIFKAEGHFGRGEALLKQGRFGEAEVAIREALKLDPSVAQYHAALGEALLRGRGAAKASDARAALEKALALNPELINAAVHRATAISLEGDLEEARRILREVLAKHPNHAEALRESRALMERSKKGESKGLLSRLLKR